MSFVENDDLTAHQPRMPIGMDYTALLQSVAFALCLYIGENEEDHSVGAPDHSTVPPGPDPVRPVSGSTCTTGGQKFRPWKRGGHMYNFGGS